MTPMEQPRTRDTESRGPSASQRGQHATLAGEHILGDPRAARRQPPQVRPAPAHLRDAEQHPPLNGGNVTIDGSITAGDQPLSAIKRACRMIIVEAGLTTVQADRIRSHVQDILAAAAEQEREVVSSRSWSHSSSG